MWKYLRLLVLPSVIGTVAAIAWYMLRDWLGINPSDRDIFQSWVALPSVVHGLIAGALISKVNEQNQKLIQALDLKNWQQFKEYEHLRIHPVIKLLLATFSLIFFFMFVLYPFVSIRTGVIIMWATMFILYLLWQVATELDDPYNGISKITKEKVYEVFEIQMNSEEKKKYVPK